MTCVAPDLLPQVRKVLDQKGFYDPGILQLIKPGQVFGVVQRLDFSLEMHVRGFKDGRLEAEIEISRDFLEHLGPNSSRPAQVELETLLVEAGIPFTPSPSTPHTQCIVIPRKLTDWRRLIAMMILTGLKAAERAVATNHPFIRRDPP